MSNKTIFEGPVPIVADKVLLYWWELGAYGAFLDLFLYWYRGTGKFCLEGELLYARIVKVAQGELCAVQENNGDFTCYANGTIKILGEKVAKFDAHVTQNVDWNQGIWQLKNYGIVVCGSNTRKLKCKEWKEDFLSNTVRPELIINSNEMTDDLQFILERPQGIRDGEPTK